MALALTTCLQYLSKSSSNRSSLLGVSRCRPGLSIATERHLNVKQLAPAVFAALAARGVRRRSRVERKAQEGKTSGRRVVLQTEVTKPLELEAGSVASMDDFMRENAAKVCLQNLQRVEAVSDESGVLLCFLEPNDVGPFRAQIRMKVMVEMAGSGRVDINILEMHPGLVNKKTGELTFDPAYKMDMTSMSSVTWQDNGSGGLAVVNYIKSRSVMKLPGWFPLPDAVVQKIISLFVDQVVKSGITKANEQIRKMYSEWKYEPVLSTEG